MDLYQLERPRNNLTSFLTLGPQTYGYRHQNVAG